MNTDSYDDWKEALLRLPDRTFFDLMRLYLGEIKTPFNKQRLVERLIGFLSKPEIQRTIVNSLDSLDILILTAVHCLPVTTRGSLLIFLSSAFSLQTRLINLEERLLLYSTEQHYYQFALTKIYRINPLLSAALEPFLHPDVLFLPQETGTVQSGESLCDDMVLAGLYSFFLKDSAALKTNGAFKVKTEKQLRTIFQVKTSDIGGFEQLCAGLQHIGLLIRSESNLIPQQERWAEFFKQRPLDRKMYIAAAISGHTRRDILRQRAQFFTDFLAALNPQGLYTDDTLKRFFDYLFQKTSIDIQDEYSLFPGMNIGMYTSDDALKIIGWMKALKFLLPVGECWQLNSSVFSQETAEQPLIADPSFELTIMPFTSLDRIFPVLNCMEPLAILTTGRFAITRAACLRCFERGVTDTALIESINEAAGGLLPQNIKVSITEWYRQCTAVGLYHGFVLTVAEDKRKLFKQHAQLQNIIYKELADGVYLMKQIDQNAIRTTVKSAGLDVTCYNTADTGRIVAARLLPVEYRPSPLEALYQATNGTTSVNAAAKPEQNYREYMRHLETLVENMPIGRDDKQSLKEKIAKKLIVTQEQLCGKPVENDVREVSGLDFLGKLRLAETAIAEQNIVEVSIEEPAGQRTITGIPIAIEKTEHDTVLLIRPQKSQTSERVSVARMLKIRAFRDSLFS